MLKNTVKWLLIISALIAIVSLALLLFGPTTTAEQSEIDACNSGARTPEEMGYPDFTCQDMEEGFMRPTLLNYLKVGGCMLCVPSTLILGVIYPFIKTPDPDGKIAMKMQQLDDVNQQLKQAKDHLKSLEQAQIERQNAISQTEERIRNLEQTGESVSTEYQSELVALQRLRDEGEKAKQDYENAQQALQILRDTGIQGTVNQNVTYNIQDSVVMGNVGDSNQDEIR